MKIAVVAANGRTGRLFVEEALSAGHYVRAGIRDKNNLQNHPFLTVVPCDATKTTDVIKLLQNQDVVCSFIGHVNASRPDVQAQATKTIVKVMRDLKINRLISLTGTGVRFPGDKITLIDRVLNLGIGIIDPDRVKDGIKHVDVLKNSDLEWTVIRVLKLQNVQPRPFNLMINGPTKPYVSRLEVALAVLQVIEQHSFVREAPIIGCG